MRASSSLAVLGGRQSPCRLNVLFNRARSSLRLCWRILSMQSFAKEVENSTNPWPISKQRKLTGMGKLKTDESSTPIDRALFCREKPIMW